MCRTGTSGEGMPQVWYRGRKAGRTLPISATLLRAALGVVFIGLVVAVNASAAQAGDDGSADQASAWSKFMQTLGLKKPPDADEDIKYTERSPLVVPPTRDLPAPAAGPASAADWPKDPKHKKHAKAKPAPVVTTATPMVNPNPPFEKKTWYNPASWFNKEEYANFTGEPARVNLTDPPTGYRTPSPYQPYGIGPEDRKTKKKTAADGTPIQTGSQTATSAPAPAATQPAAPAATQPAASAAPQPGAPTVLQPQSEAGK